MNEKDYEEIVRKIQDIILNWEMNDISSRKAFASIKNIVTKEMKV